MRWWWWWEWIVLHLMAQIMDRQRQSDGRSASVSRCGIVYLACTREALLAHWRLVRDCFLTGCAAPRPVPVQLQLYAGREVVGGGGVRGRSTQLFFFFLHSEAVSRHVASD